MNVCPHDGFLIKCPNPNHQVEKKNFLNITLKSWNWPGISGPLNKQYPPFGASRTKLLGHSPLTKLLPEQLLLKLKLTADEMT